MGVTGLQLIQPMAQNLRVFLLSKSYRFTFLMSITTQAKVSVGFIR